VCRKAVTGTRGSGMNFEGRFEGRAVLYRRYESAISRMRVLMLHQHCLAHTVMMHVLSTMSICDYAMPVELPSRYS
jgi:hypothetical protein